MAIARRFLVTAANGDLAEAVAGVLRETYCGALIHGTEANGTWPAGAVFDEVHQVPLASHRAYPSALRDVATKIGATLVIPCNEHELVRLAAEPGEAAKLPLLMLRRDLVLNFCDKLETNSWLSRSGIPGPWTVSLKEANPDLLPFVIKPRRSAGSHGVRLIRTRAHLLGVQDEYGDEYVAQAWLPDDHAEFTCALLRVLGETRTLTLRRRLDAGRTVSAFVEDHPAITALLHRVAEAANLDGAMNVQLRIAPDGPMIFEINPRFSSTVKMRHALGFKDLIWAIEAMQGRPPPSFVPCVGANVHRLSREVIGPSSAAARTVSQDG